MVFGETKDWTEAARAINSTWEISRKFDFLMSYLDGEETLQRSSKHKPSP